ncbi:SH3 domain-containing protein [Streptomyces beihaiensis]|uniref:SH3 domain-containing protein n=1 Tax=Streptomyces beihaiensis TaxID=2984495 RepID=A0ABT3U589_9ACTN|nr:SH3 domain-containing protein [Streptomyces beihaiensis]MCX3063826.1 SH3 domain-containing protein [Streptomyces beihaiensis]
MAIRTAATRLGAAVAVAALAAVTAAASPALADGDGGHHGDHHAGHHRTYKGRVVANGGLNLRDAPTRGSRIVRWEPYGAIVPIFCKTGGQNVRGNYLWYLLTDGTWAWGSAKYIDNIGAAPRWC